MSLATAVSAAAAAQTKSRDLYLGQTPPGETPQVFAAGTVSMEGSREYCLALTPDGREIYFNRAGVGVMVCIWSLTRANGGWGDVRYLFFTRNTADGGDIYWVSAAIIERFRETSLQQ
jgi:hypothetical protein